jgi:hypothetical protein
MEVLLGVLASVLVQTIKQKFGGGIWTIAVLAVFSIALAGLYSLVVYAGYWETVSQIMIYAGAFYAFFIQRFEGVNLFKPEELER